MKINTHWQATQRVIAAKFNRLTHKIEIQLHLVAESCTVYRYRSRRPVRKLLDTPSYVEIGIPSPWLCSWRECIQDTPLLGRDCFLPLALNTSKVTIIIYCQLVSHLCTHWMNIKLSISCTKIRWGMFHDSWYGYIILWPTIHQCQPKTHTCHL
jgi:hypothetical protein